MSSYLFTLSNAVSIIINIYIWVIIIRVLISWVQPNPNSSFMFYLSKLTDPVLNFARRAFPLRLGGLDFSPIIVILFLSLIGSLLTAALRLIAFDQPLTLLIPFLAIQLLALIESLIFLLGILMVIRLVLSLVNASPYNPLVLIVYGVTEPLLQPLRRWFPQGPRGLDIKALVFLIGLVILYILINQLRMSMV